MRNIVFYKKLQELYDEIPTAVMSNFSNIEFPTHNWHMINSVPHYYKKTDDRQLINELLGSYITKCFGLKSVDYQIVTKDDKQGIASPIFFNPENFYFYASDFYFSPNNHHSLLKLKNMCSNDRNFKQLVDEIISLSISDFYRDENDRHACNICFEKDLDITLAPIFDFGNSYRNNVGIENPIFNIDFYSKKIKLESAFKDFIDFPLFKEKLLLILSLDMEEMLKNIESIYQIKISEKLKRAYLNTDKKKKTLVKELGTYF
ncbi:MAG: hypothetical protein R3Y21_03980 [Mycoplasmatota bacterium]